MACQFDGYSGEHATIGKFRWIADEPRSDNDLLKLEFNVFCKKISLENLRPSSPPKGSFTEDLIVVWDPRLSKIGWQVKGISHSKTKRT